MDGAHRAVSPAEAQAGAPAASSAAWARSRTMLGPLLVLAVTVLTLVSLPKLQDVDAAYRQVDALAYVLVGAAAVATAVRVRWPAMAAVVCGAAVGAYLASSYPYGPIFGFVVLTVYAVARRRTLGAAGAASAAVLAMLLAHVPVNDAALAGPAAVLPALAWVSIPLTVGAARRTVARAQQRERLVAEQRLVDAERLRVSQEVHDVVGHGLAAIQMQADITLHVHSSEADRMRAALEAISRASHEALEELRATLDSVRGTGGSQRSGQPPAPGLSRVPELCARIAQAGVEVDVSVRGGPRPLPAAADAAAYRVLQEALTNVVKHSPHPHATVVIGHDARAVTLEVTNQDMEPVPAEGIGISGMRRRVAQVGGTFHAGSGRRPGTFQVRATIPRPPEEPAR